MSTAAGKKITIYRNIFKCSFSFSSGEDAFALLHYAYLMKRKIILPSLALVIVIALVLSYVLSPDTVSYRDFREAAERGEVSSVTLKQNSIEYTAGDGRRLRTDNPSTPTLKEELLLKGIAVKDERESSLESTLNNLFNIIFLLAVAFGIYKLITYAGRTFHIVKKTGVTFSDIAGMNDVKEEIMAAVRTLSEAKPSSRTVRGIILEGPPGNGKTLFARALASECGVSFISSRGADFQGAVMGLGAFKVKLLFSKAKRNRPCIIFIDEFDSIGEKRNYAGSGIDKENNRILTTLLNEMDGFRSSERILVLAATNSYESLDSALVRPGRFDLKFTIPNPDAPTRIELIRMYLGNTALEDGLNEEALSLLFSGLSAAAIETVLSEAKSLMERRKCNAIGRTILAEAAQKTRTKLNTRH